MDGPATLQQQQPLPARSTGRETLQRRCRRAHQIPVWRAKDGLLSHRFLRINQAEVRVLETHLPSLFTDSNSCNKNAKSNLLRLPREVREQIYELVIGGHHLQIHHLPIQTRSGRPRTQGRRPGDLLYSCTPWDLVWDYTAQVYRPTYPFDWPDSFNHGPRVTLLARVCRQLHQETSLLLYKLNLFSFGHPWMKRMWFESLKPIQMETLRRIFVQSPGFKWPQDDDEHVDVKVKWPLTKVQIKQLCGLVAIYGWDDEKHVVKSIDHIRLLR